MKVKLAIALCLLALVMMTGCSDDDNGVGHDSNLVGTWDLTSATFNGVPTDPPNWSATFNADGTGTITEEGTTKPLTWSTSGSNLTVNSGDDGATTGVYNVSGNTLTYTFTEDGGTIALTWTKRT